MKGVTAAVLAEEIGDRLKQARLNRNLTQAEVAEARATRTEKQRRCAPPAAEPALIKDGAQAHLTPLFFFFDVPFFLPMAVVVVWVGVEVPLQDATSGVRPPATTARRAGRD